jgi:hypothetical protein
MIFIGKVARSEPPFVEVEDRVLNSGDVLPPAFWLTSYYSQSRVPEALASDKHVFNSMNSTASYTDNILLVCPLHADSGCHMVQSWHVQRRKGLLKGMRCYVASTWFISIQCTVLRVIVAHVERRIEESHEKVI